MKKPVFITTLTAILLTCLVVLAAPGDANDPLISYSYMTYQIEGLKNYINDRIANPTPATVNYKFNLIEVQGGQTLIAGEGAEFIIRQGHANIISTLQGGVANVTTGIDLPNGTPAPRNALLVIPRSDGRGIYAEDYLLVLIKGSYTIH